MTMFMLQPGDFFSCKDVFREGKAAFGVVLTGHNRALIIHGDGDGAEFTPQCNAIPHSAVPLTTTDHDVPREIMLALDAVKKALSY